MIRTETRFVCDCGAVLTENKLPVDYVDAKLALLAFGLLHRDCQPDTPKFKTEVTEHDGLFEQEDELWKR